MKNDIETNLKLARVLCRVGACGCAVAGLILMFLRNLPLGLLFICIGLYGSLLVPKLITKYEEAHKDNDR